MRETVAVCDLPPPVPVMVMVWVPVLARELTVTVIFDVPEPGAAIEAGLKLTVAPEIWLADKATAELKPPETAVVMVEVPDLPRATDSVVGDALRVKLALGAAVMVRETVVFCVMLPLVPVTVMVYVPVAAPEATVKVNCEVPAPVMEVGLNAAVTLDGRLDADSPIDASKPPETVVVMVEVPELPWTTETDAGNAEMAKLGAETMPARVFEQAAPVRTAPARGQIVAGDGRIAVAAARDVMKIGGIACAYTQCVNGRVNEAEQRVAIEERLLIGQSQVAGPHGRRKTGSAIVVRRAGGLVGADVKVKIRFRRHVRGIPIGLWIPVGRGDHAGELLPRRNRNVVRRNAAAAVRPGGFRTPGAARAAGRQIRAADRRDIRIIRRVNMWILTCTGRCRRPLETGSGPAPRTS